MKHETRRKRRKQMEPACKHCRRFAIDHVQNRCMYSPTVFEAATCERCQRPFRFSPNMEGGVVVDGRIVGGTVKWMPRYHTECAAEVYKAFVSKVIGR
jgi:hypothetical protein